LTKKGKYFNFKMENYLIVTIKSWNIENFFKFTKKFKGNWHLISKKENLNLKNIDRINPKKIFFIHWSWIIPREIFEKYECISFHITDLPFGRGGSPLQNLIARGLYNTKISAFRVVQELDAGEIYLKKPINIEFGSAEEIFMRASKIIFKMIEEIITKDLIPKPQQGKVVKFKRRTSEDGNLKDIKNLKTIYDFIRMLDGEGYPKAFIKINNIKYEFYNASYQNDVVKANVVIKKIDDENGEK